MKHVCATECPSRLLRATVSVVHPCPAHRLYPIGSTLERALKMTPEPDQLVLAAAATGGKALWLSHEDPASRGTLPPRQSHPSQDWAAPIPCLWGDLWWSSIGLAKPQIAGCSSCLPALWLEGPSREGWHSRRKDQACQPEEAKPQLVGCGGSRV